MLHFSIIYCAKINCFSIFRKFSEIEDGYLRHEKIRRNTSTDFFKKNVFRLIVVHLTVSFDDDLLCLHIAAVHQAEHIHALSHVGRGDVV